MILDLILFEQMGFIKTGINWKDPQLHEAMKNYAEATTNLANAIKKCPPDIFEKTIKKIISLSNQTNMFQ